eukprot:gene21189-biopygen5648
MGPQPLGWGRGRVFFSWRGRCAVPPTPPSPLYLFGSVSLCPHPQTSIFPFVSSPPGVGLPFCFPHNPYAPAL